MAAEQLSVPAAVVSCHRPGHPEGCADWQGAVVFQWDSDRHYRDLSDADVETGIQFLALHGIEHGTFMIGNSLLVRARCDGGLWLDTWRAVKEDGTDAIAMCEHCPACPKQEQLVVPLVAPIPDVLTVGAYVDDVLRGVAVGVA